MKCREYQLHISRLVDGELDAADADTVRNHMAECARCREFFARLRSVGVELFALRDAMRVPDMNSVVLARLARHRRSELRSPIIPAWAQVPLMAALVLMAVGLGHVAGTSMTGFLAPNQAQESADVLLVDSAPSFADVAMQIAYEEPGQ
ncbi:MAG: zf-HC2 domain-containing protein [Thermodesulfobacteriota bacterium]